jgi:protocatechuate 3,4-dioxygenase alpha subunit
VSLPPTPSQTVGPFFSFGLLREPRAQLVRSDAPGAVRLEGRVLDGAGDPVDDALVEIWHPDIGFGRCGTGAEGRFEFVIAKPGRAEGQAPHLAVMVFARGLLRQAMTRIYFPGEETNAADPVLSSIPDPDDRATLVAREEAGALRFDIRLQGERQTVFFAV